MKAWQVWTVFGLFVLAAAVSIPMEIKARRLREEERKRADEWRKAVWRAHWEEIRPKAMHELPVEASPSIVPELQEMRLDTS